MSYQYSSSSHNSTAMDISHPAYACYSPQRNASMEVMDDADKDSLGIPGEKKRNKLGYARINIACGNCRHRKIRCKALKNDPRCEACARLGKDCQFYTVDQQPPPPSRARSAGPRGFPKPMLASASTPPILAPGHPGDIPTEQGYGTKSLPVRPGGTSGSTYSYGQGPDNWLHSDDSSGSLKQDEAQLGWRNFLPDSSAASGYVPYSVAAAQTLSPWGPSPLEASVRPESNARAEGAWSPYQHAVRSMSFSGEPSTPCAGGMSRPYDRKGSVASDMYPSSGIDTISPAPYTAWQQPYQPWYAEGGQPTAPSATEHPPHIDGVYYRR
ncbi:hypothetical protein GGS20DRAFT_45651 [Poronia punctata]|nr:hypothetical protein GGS20DRAFT_45651 [Poronia punctata]